MIKTKWTLFLQTALMYLGHGFYLFALIATQFEELETIPFPLLAGIGTGVLFLAAVFGLVGAILSLAGLRKGLVSPVKATFIVKILLIPWYVMNLYYCFVIVAAFLNPWMMMLIPLEIFLSVCVTYAFMVLSGIPDVVYAVKALKDRRVKPSALLIVGIVFQFVFVLDVVGAGLIWRAFRKAETGPETEAVSG